MGSKQSQQSGTVAKTKQKQNKYVSNSTQPRTHPPQQGALLDKMIQGWKESFLIHGTVPSKK